MSYARSLSFTAALLVASIICLFLTAAPQAPPPKGGPEVRPITAGMAPTAPVTFADPDGQELILEELSVRTAIHGMLSLTELELRFRNPQSRRIEGRFTCTLPPNAAISRFAKEVNGQLMEGEVVERVRANQVYEQFLHQMRDPALLEQDQGNRFSARIFPIEANAPVRLVLSYTALLPMRGGERTYALPLRGLSKVNKLTFRAFVSPLPGEETKSSSSISGPGARSTAEMISFEEQDYTPDRDIVLTWRPSSEAPRSRVLRAGDFYLAAIRPDVRPPNRQPSTAGWLFYVDTSASSAEGAAHRIRVLEEVLAALPAQSPVQLVAFDNDVVPLASGSAAEMSRRAGDLLRNRLFLGGTDLAAVIGDAARALRDDPSRTIVFASDLVPTLGQVAANEIRDAIGSIPPKTTIHALILGSREDSATAKALTAGRGRVVRVPFTESIAAQATLAAEALRRPLGASVDVTDRGAEWVYPARAEDVAAGDEVIVLGKVKAGTDPSPQWSGGLQAAVSRLEASTYGPLLEREAYRAYLEYLAEREANEPSEAIRRALGTEQVRISVEQRVLIPRTTLLVLESEQDYQRFQLDRRALAAILTIDAGGIGRIDRRAQNWTPPPPPPPPVRRKIERPQAVPVPTAPPPGEPAPVPPPEQEESFAFDAVQEMVAGEADGQAVMAEAPAVVDAAPAAAESRSAGIINRSFRRPGPSPRPTTVQPADKKDTSDWTRTKRPTRERIAELQAKLNDDPRDREVYNQLSDALTAHNEWTLLRTLALRWQPYDPENPQVYEILGIADEQLGKETEAARAYASLIEVAPAKPELLQRAGLLLIRSRRASLAEAPLRRALEMRPDRANGYRNLAFMLWREGRVEEAARVLESATRQNFPAWYGNVQRVIREELGYVYRAWMKKDPSRRSEIAARAREYEVDLDRTDALRVTLAWETDANDVDLHVVDPSGEEVFYSHKDSRSGLQLYEDITQGLGPEVIRTSKLDRGTYHVGVRYFAAGPMGVSRGLVIVLRGDDMEIHPFRLVEGGGEIRYVAGIPIK